MLSFLNDLVGGWRETRTLQGYSYQVSRTGKRRVVPVDNYGRRGEIDHEWLATGEFSDAQMHRRFKNYHLVRANRAARRVQTAGA